MRPFAFGIQIRPSKLRFFGDILTVLPHLPSHPTDALPSPAATIIRSEFGACRNWHGHHPMNPEAERMRRLSAQQGARRNRWTSQAARSRRMGSHYLPPKKPRRMRAAVEAADSAVAARAVADSVVAEAGGAAARAGAARE